MAFWGDFLITVSANLITVFANDSDHRFCKFDHRFCKSNSLYPDTHHHIGLSIPQKKRGKHRAVFPRIGGHSM